MVEGEITGTHRQGIPFCGSACSHTVEITLGLGHESEQHFQVVD